MNQLSEFRARSATESGLPSFLTHPNPSIFERGSFCVIDFETSTLEKGSPLNERNRILCACWMVVSAGTVAGDPRSVTHKQILGGENDLEELLRDISSVDFIVAHGAKFELGWLKRAGLDLRTVLVFDTLLGEWVLAGNVRRGLSLEDSAIRHNCSSGKDIVGSWIRSGVDTENIPRAWLLKYCHQDVAVTRELFTLQLVQLRERNQLHLVYQRGLVCACLADIEFNGIKLDESRVYDEYERVRREYLEVQQALREYGEINWESPKQVANLLYDTLLFKEPTDRSGEPIRTDKGARSANKNTLALLKPSNKRQRQFLELYQRSANLNARLSKNLEFFKGVCKEYDGIFYGQFNQGHTATHRLSSSGRKLSFQDGTVAGVQMQNMAREYKRLFKAKRNGWQIAEVDGSALEFRVAAELGSDPVAYDEIVTGADVHAITAKALTDAGEPTERQAAKSRTFRPLFGGSSGTLAEREYCKFFRKKYSEIYKTQTKWTQQVAASKIGELITPYGMRFYWPGTKMSRSGYIDNTTSIFNYPIQSLATAEIIPIAVVFFWHRIKDHDIELVNTIHDSVVAEVAPNETDFLKETSVQSFTKDVYAFLKNCYNYSFSVPLGVEIKIGANWGEGSGEKHTVFPDN